MSLDKSRRARTWIGALLRSTACGAARGPRVLRRRKPRLIGAPAWPSAVPGAVGDRFLNDLFLERIFRNCFFRKRTRTYSLNMFMEKNNSKYFELFFDCFLSDTPAIKLQAATALARGRGNHGPRPCEPWPEAVGILARGRASPDQRPSCAGYLSWPEPVRTSSCT